MKKISRCFIVVPALLLLVSCADIKSDPATLPQNIVDRAAATVDRFRDNADLSYFRDIVHKSRAVVILPSVVKAGFIGGGEAGHGVLLVRKADDSWSDPAFYTLGGASIGFQLGIQESEVILAIRSKGALDAILADQMKLGGKLGVTVGMLGAGAEASTTSNLGADVIAVSYSTLGIFGGLSLEGSVLARRNDFNEAYYAAGATPKGIVLDGKFTNPATDKLKTAIGNM